MTSKPKYGPTPDYGPCECEDCESDARSTCPTCEGHFCYGHAAHAVHAPAVVPNR